MIGERLTSFDHRRVTGYHKHDYVTAGLMLMMMMVMVMVYWGSDVTLCSEV